MTELPTRPEQTCEQDSVSRLNEIERRLRLYDAVLSNTPDLVYVFDLNHRFIYANDGLLRMWGRTWDEAIGKNCLELGYEPWHAAMHDREIDQVIATKQPIKGEVPFTGTFGRRIYEYIFVPVLDKDGDVEAVAGTTRDVTERRRSEEQIAQSDRFHRAISELSMDYAFEGTIGSDGTVQIEKVSEGFAKFYGFTLDEMNAQGGWGSVIHPDDHTKVGKTIERLLAGQRDRGEVRGLCSDGSIKWQSYLTVPIRDSKSDRTIGLFGAATDITGHRQLTERLREQAETLRSFYDTAPVMMGVVEVHDDDLIHLTDNAATSHFFGIKPDSLNGKRASQMGVHTEHLREWIKHYRESERTGKPARFEYIHETSDGPRWISAIVFCIEQLSGGRSRCSYVAEDVTERKHVEDALRDAERRWRDLAEALPNLVWTDLPDGQCDYLSSQWEAYTGIPVEQLLGLNWLEIVIHPDDRARTLATWLTAVADKGEYDLEYRIRRSDGVYHWFKTRGVPIRDSQGQIIKWFGTCTDIQDQKQAVEELQQSEERFARFMQHLPGLAWVKDSEGRYVFANDAALTAFGRSRNDIHGKTDKDLFPVETAEQFQRNDRQALDSGSGVQVVETLKHEDGVHYSVVSKFPIPDRDGRPPVVGGVAIDITELKKAEEALRDADRRKDEFLATLAHELRNPLAPIRNSLQILKMPRVDSDTIERSREMMERQVHHLVRLVDDLLDVSRVMRGKIELRKERIELATIIARAVETVQPLIDAQGHQLTIQLSQESLLIEADPIRLTQVVGNLLTNAAKYTEPGGTIWLTADRNRRTAQLSIRDNGIGIAADMLSGIFELFVQVDHASTKSQGGLGIGLTLVKNLVEMHGGKIEAKSDGLGKGSEFILTLPLALQNDDHIKGAESEQVQGRQPSKSGFRLMVVDDNQDAATSLAMLFKLQDHDVRVAFSGTEAIEVTKSFVPDAIFMDIGMPGMDGYETARLIRTQPNMKNTVIVALTGWGQKEDRRRTAEAGFNYHFVKPPELKALNDVLATLRR